MKLTSNYTKSPKGKRRVNGKVVSVLVIVISLLIAYGIYRSPPTLPSRLTPTTPRIAVETLRLHPQDFPVTITSYGRTYPKTQIELSSQVSGQIQWVGDNFRRGKSFEKGEPLIQLDQRDFQADVEIARANLVAAQQRLIEEKALGETAQQNWERHKTHHNASSAVSALTLRQPQLKTATANVQSAQANLQKATLALERTIINAPFSGRIEEIFVGIGQVITPSRLLARLHSTHALEIRLPISPEDWQWMTPPFSMLHVRFSLAEEAFNPLDSEQLTHTEDIRHTRLSDSSAPNQTAVWQGNIVATDSVVDNTSQQRHAIAEIMLDNTETDLIVGQYLKASITGNMLDQVMIIPNTAIQQGLFVYRVIEDQLQRTRVRIGWQGGQQALITQGLQEGDTIVVSPLGQTQSGAPVRIIAQKDQSTGTSP